MYPGQVTKFYVWYVMRDNHVIIIQVDKYSILLAKYLVVHQTIMMRLRKVVRGLSFKATHSW